MKREFLIFGAAMLLAGCAATNERVYNRSHALLSEPLAMEVYSQKGGKPKFARNATYSGRELVNGGTTYERGVSVTGDAILVYALNEDKTTLEACVCMDESSPKEAKANVKIKGNGKVIWEEDVKKSSFFEVKQVFKGAENMMIEVTGDPDAVVDILEPRLEGGVRLRETMTFGRTNYAAQCKLDDFEPFPTESKKGVTVFCRPNYLDYGPVIGVSNAYACVMVAPNHHGMLVHYGPDSQHTFGGTVQAFLQPEEEIVPTRKYGAMVANTKNWKWRIEDDGAIRVLAAPDLLNGVRRMIVYRLDSRSGELTIDAMSKNITNHDVISCLSLVTRFPEGYPVVIPAEKTRPGYSLVKGSDEGIVAKDVGVLINQLEDWFPLKGPQKLLQKDSGDFLLMQKNGYFESRSQAPKDGRYPYDGLKLSLYNSKSGVLVTQYGEKLKMSKSQTLHLRVKLDLVGS
ncbi:NPCBM/NEW2 domain-containing protein [bacterium]|nr:NPCBM/NEW2 domain-containing protein [bacterium]